MLILQDGYLVAVPDTGTGTSTITIADNSLPPLNPVMVTRVAGAVESGNQVSRLIDGSDAIRLVGDTNLTTGTLVLLFTDDASVHAARTMFARPAAFTLTVPDRPAVGMTFVREGALNPGMHDERRDVWEFEVGFREVDL